VVALPAVLTTHEATAWLAQWRKAVAGASGGAKVGTGAVLTLDASALQRFDTAALAVLLDCRRHAQSLGKTLAVSGLAPRLQDLARLYGVEALLIAPG
jgi:phospholipid transport system transporter-binding protein